MDDMAEKVRQIEPVWDDLKEQRLLNRIHDQLDAPEECLAEESHLAKPATRRWPSRVLALVALASVAAGAFLWLQPDPLATNNAPSRLELQDGSSLSFSAGAGASVIRDQSDEVVVRQTRGEVRYEVTPNLDREFHVQAGHVRVSVLGTAFNVSMDGNTVRVAVHRGRVAVTVQGRRVELTRGEEFSSSSSDLATLDGTEALATPDDTLAEPENLAGLLPDDNAEQQRGAPPASTTRTPVPELMETESGVSQPDYAERMALVDAARARGDYVSAAEMLRSMLAEGPRAGQRVTGWFTLGRLEARQGNHLAAADAFRRARLAAPSGALSLDALAREALARERAGERGLATQLANEYLQRAPAGHHQSAMRGIIE